VASAAGLTPAEMGAVMADSMTLGLATARSTVERLRLLSFRRRAQVMGAELVAAATAGDDDALVSLIGEAGDLEEPTPSLEPSVDAVSFINQGVEPYDWIVPGVLEAGDRMLLTAGEGAGKSILLMQCAAQVAAGVHWWTLKPIPAQPVLLVDLENSPRLVRRRLSDLEDRTRAPLSELRVEVPDRDVDLTTAAGVAWLTGKVKANRPRLLVIGPLYRLMEGTPKAGDVGGEDQARRVVKSLNRIRHAFGCAILLEHHAPHGDSRGGPRNLRPFGSSVWLRWPDFGIGIRQKPVKDKGEGAPVAPLVFSVGHWRGPRDERIWPVEVTRDRNGWPWKATLRGEGPPAPSDDDPGSLVPAEDF
jgi:hypothetical protein